MKSIEISTPSSCTSFLVSVSSVDGADESTKHLHLIKGGGGALTREKIVAAGSDKFVCIADDTKLVDVLGKFPLPIEVIPMAQSMVAREIVKLGGTPELREGFTTDNGNIILDVRNMEIIEPLAMETAINQIAGVVTVGIFAHRPADVLVLGGAEILELKKNSSAYNAPAAAIATSDSIAAFDIACGIVSFSLGSNGLGIM